jgi:hypothetical protein
VEEDFLLSADFTDGLDRLNHSDLVVDLTKNVAIVEIQSLCQSGLCQWTKSKKHQFALPANKRAEYLRFLTVMTETRLVVGLMELSKCSRSMRPFVCTGR